MLRFMSNSRSKHHPFQDNPVAEAFLQWMDSPEGQRYIGVSDVLNTLMQNVQLDVRGRRIVWSEDERLTVDQSVTHIRKQHPDFAADQIRRFLISWIENYAPAEYTDEQLNELDQLADEWVAQLRRTSQART
jgi:ABC-type glycerol-3-phosphate transport system substrate-binding protein